MFAKIQIFVQEIFAQIPDGPTPVLSFSLPSPIIYTHSTFSELNRASLVSASNPFSSLTSSNHLSARGSANTGSPTLSGYLYDGGHT